MSLFATPTGEAFRLNLLDTELVAANHGLVAADTGSGKSFAFGALVIDQLARGAHAVLVDNGGSWRRLTEVFGGTYVPVDLHTSISPFGSYEDALGRDGQLDPEALDDDVRFLEVCVCDYTLPSFDKLSAAVASRAVRLTYERLRLQTQRKALVGDFRDTLAAHPWEHPDDKRRAEELARRLADFCEGTYSAMLNRPNALNLQASLLTLDIAAVSKNATTKALALANIVQAVANRAAHTFQRHGRRTLFAVDEAHELLRGESSALFLENAYRKFRKNGVACWSISQHFRDFLQTRSGESLLANSKLKLFLYHEKGNHEAIASHFRLNEREAAAFEGLQRHSGYFSDALLSFGPRAAVVRLAPDPLMYWLLTTDPGDNALLAHAQALNPGLPLFDLCQQMARHYPRGSRSAPRRVA